MSTNDEPPKPTVPKFSSFKAKDVSAEPKAPKFSSFKPKEAEKRRVSDEDRDEGSKSKRSRHSESRHPHRSRHSDEHRHGSLRRHRDESKRSSQSRTPDQPTSASKPARETDAVSRLYVIDLKGDPLILKYGGSDKSQIPAYWRYGSGRVLGTKGRLVIHRDGPRDQFSLRMPGEGSYTFKDRDGLRTKNWRVTSNPRRIRTKQTESKSDEVEDFLPLTTSKQSKRDLDSESSDEDKQPNYRSIEGKAKAQELFASDSESDIESEANAEVVDVQRDNPLKWKSIQLSRQVKDQPHDIDAWLELVSHQDALLRAGEDIDHKALESEVHSYAEIKLSMLESALSNVVNSKDRLRILVPLMREGVKVWNGKTAAKKWADLRKDEEASFTLWKTHLDFAMSDIATFHYDDVKKMHVGRLHEAIQRSSLELLQANYSEAIYIFLRLTRFVHDSGYKELAVAAWQAVLELNVFRPPHIDDRNEALSEFADFWESEVPRIGEPNAQGWNRFVESKELQDPPEPLHGENSHTSQSRDDYKAWGSLERGRAEKAGLPARTMDEGNDDDPFRVVMFSDLEQLLFVIPRSALQDMIPQLLDAFLIFLRLPPAYRTSSWTEDAYRDQFLASPSPETQLPANERPTETDPLSEEVQRRSPAFDQLGYHGACSLDELFSGSGWFSHLPQRSRANDDELKLATNATRQLVHAAKIESLAQYYLGLCAVQDGTGIKKPAKALLTEYPDNLALFGAYALAEYANGNYKVVGKTLDSAAYLVIMNKDLSPTNTDGDRPIVSEPAQADWFDICRIRAIMEFEQGNKELAIRRLCSSVDKSLHGAAESISVSQLHLLKAQQTFSNCIMQSLSAGQLNEAAVYVECLGLLSYLTAEGCTEPTSTEQGNISSVMTVFQVQSVEFKVRGYETSTAHEKMLQFAARLLYMNAKRGPFRRAYMLEQLKRFIAYFPRNTIFLALFEWADSSLRVIDEVRTLLHEQVLLPGHDGVSSRLFAIQHEMRRGNVNTTKAAFEDAVRSDECKSSVPLWTLFIRFCSSYTETKAKAKDVLFRAMRHCPWSKAIMMEAFVTVTREMDSAELRGVFDTMTSKGLRIHVDLDEFLEKRRREKRGNRSRK